MPLPANCGSVRLKSGTSTHDSMSIVNHCPSPNTHLICFTSKPAVMHTWELQHTDACLSRSIVSCVRLIIKQRIDAADCLVCDCCIYYHRFTNTWDNSRVFCINNPLKPGVIITVTLWMFSAIKERPNPPFLISDIWALWRSWLSARVPECQKLKMVGWAFMAKCNNSRSWAIKG